MPRARDPNRDRAYEIWHVHGGNITNRQIAEQLGVDEKKIAVWKQRDKWNVVQQADSNVVQQKKRGAPKGNKNAVGNSSGAPAGNKRAVGNEGGPGAGETGRIEGDSIRLRTILYPHVEDKEQVWGNSPAGFK